MRVGTVAAAAVIDAPPLPDTDDDVDAEPAGELPDLGVRRGRVISELTHLSRAPRSAGPTWAAPRAREARPPSR